MLILKHITIQILLALCAIPAAAWAADGSLPRPNLDVAVGIVQEGETLCVLVFSAEGGGTITAWNMTDGGTPMEPNPFSLGDADWGSDLGHAPLELDGEPHAIVAVVDGPPEIIRAVEAVPYTDENTNESWSYLQVRGDNERLVVQQTRGHGFEYNGTMHHFYGVDEPPVEVQGLLPVDTGSDTTMTVVNIDGENYAVVNTVEGPPVLVDALEAATLGLGDITEATPADYVRWDHPPRLISVAVDLLAVVGVFDGGNGTAYASIGAGGATTIYDITNPLDRREVFPVGNATTLPGDAVQVASGLGVAHAVLEHHGRAALDIPERFRLGDAAARFDPAGTWAVLAEAGGGILLIETNPNTAVAVVRDGARVLAVEEADGWEEVRSGVNFGDPGVRVYDMADPGAPRMIDAGALPQYVPGAPGRAITAEIDGAAWALVPVREDLVDGPVMEVGSLDSNLRLADDSLSASISVRNVHHEAITVSVDRLTIGDLVLEQYHSYSSFGASAYGDIRLRGPTTYGFIGPTEAYGATGGLTIDTPSGRVLTVPAVHVVYSVPDLGVVYAFARSNAPTVLAPGEAKTVGFTLIDPCHDGIEHEIPIDGGCGPWDYDLDPMELAGELRRFDWRQPTAPAEITLVAEGYPERSVTVSQE